MNNLSVEIKKFVIITFTKSHHFITEEQNEKLKHLSLTDKIEIDGCWVAMSNIAEVLTIEKYYQEYPDERPQEKKPFYGEGMFRRPSPKGKELIIKGYRQYIQEQGGWDKVSENCREVYNHLRKGMTKEVYQEMIKSF